MLDFIARLSSRKFLLVAGGLLIIAANILTEAQANNIVQLILAFVAAEGVADSVGRYQEGKTNQKQLDKETARIETLGEDTPDVNKAVFTPGIPDFPM